jgi:hypothetical protein
MTDNAGTASDDAPAPGETIRYAALEASGKVYGLARHVEGPNSVRWEHIDRTTGEWVPSPSVVAAGWWTGVGGVTNAEPVTPAEAMEIARALRADLRRLDPKTLDWIPIGPPADDPS